MPTLFQEYISVKILLNDFFLRSFQKLRNFVHPHFTWCSTSGFQLPFFLSFSGNNSSIFTIITNITYKRKLIPLLNFVTGCISTKSIPESLLMEELTIFLKRLGFWSSLAISFRNILTIAFVLLFNFSYISRRDGW